MSCLYILEINPLLVASFAIIFSDSESCLFILSVVSFAVQKLLSLIRSHLFVFILSFITLGGAARGSCCHLCQSVLPMFSSKSFIVFGLTFRSLIHFIFVYGVRECSNFILLHMAVQFSQHHLLQRLWLCSNVCSGLLCQRLGGQRCVGLSLGFLSCSANLYFYLCATTILS